MTTFNNVDLNLLRVFQAIVEEGGLTSAGNRLHLSQPAVSYALNRLRQIFNDPLFVRTKEGMQPTPAAIELAKPIGRALQAVQDALRYAEKFDPLHSTRLFQCSMTDVAEMVFLPPMCERLRTEAPDIRLHVEQVLASKAEDALRTGRLDFAIGNLPSLKQSTCYELLFRESYVCMTRQRDSLPKREILLTDEFLNMTHVAVQSAESSHVQLEDTFRTMGIFRNVGLHIPHFSVLPDILARSDLAVTLPLRIARLFQSKGAFTTYNLQFDLPAADITLHWHADFDHDPGNRWMRELIVNMLQEYGRTS